jgi:hypothetical protein
MTTSFHEPNDPAGLPEVKTRVELPGKDGIDTGHATSKPEPAKTAGDRAGTRLWRELGKKLKSVLSQLKEDECLVLCEKGSNHFVQFMNQGSLPPKDLGNDAQLTRFATRLLRGDEFRAADVAVGWQATPRSAVGRWRSAVTCRQYALLGSTWACGLWMHHTSITLGV